MDIYKDVDIDIIIDIDIYSKSHHPIGQLSFWGQSRSIVMVLSSLRASESEFWRGYLSALITIIITIIIITIMIIIATITILIITLIYCSLRYIAFSSSRINIRSCYAILHITTSVLITVPT